MRARQHQRLREQVEADRALKSFSDLIQRFLHLPLGLQRRRRRAVLLRLLHVDLNGENEGEMADDYCRGALSKFYYLFDVIN